jgi:putative ABC transport system permease protein
VLRLTLASLLARRLRLVTSGLAVVLGVAFTAGALVLTDTIGQTFRDLFAGANAGTDAVVRSREVLEGGLGRQRARVDAGVAALVARVEGVAAAEGTVEEAYAQLLDAGGEPVGGGGFGAPSFGGSWITSDELNPFTLIEGRPPTGRGEVVVDADTADEAGLAVGDTTRVLIEAGAEAVEVVGLAQFGAGGGVARYVFFTLDEAQRLLAEAGRVDAVRVVADDGVGQEEVRRRLLAAAVPDGVEVLTGEELTDEEQDLLAEGLRFFGRFLLVFAGIALFVGAFIIHNTFSILIAQRARELAVLRAVGASRGQVRSSIRWEALLIATFGLAAALGIGIFFGWVLVRALADDGFSVFALPTTQLAAFTALTAVLTLAASVFPAAWAGRRHILSAIVDR